MGNESDRLYAAVEAYKKGERELNRLCKSLCAWSQQYAEIEILYLDYKLVRPLYLDPFPRLTLVLKNRGDMRRVTTHRGKIKKSWKREVQTTFKGLASAYELDRRIQLQAIDVDVIGFETLVFEHAVDALFTNDAPFLLSVIKQFGVIGMEQSTDQVIELTFGSEESLSDFKEGSVCTRIHHVIFEYLEQYDVFDALKLDDVVIRAHCKSEESGEDPFAIYH